MSPAPGGPSCRMVRACLVPWVRGALGPFVPMGLVPWVVPLVPWVDPLVVPLDPWVDPLVVPLVPWVVPSVPLVGPWVVPWVQDYLVLFDPMGLLPWVH